MTEEADKLIHEYARHSSMLMCEAHAKQCALIALDLALKFADKRSILYLEGLKKEIESI